MPNEGALTRLPPDGIAKLKLILQTLIISMFLVTRYHCLAWLNTLVWAYWYEGHLTTRYIRLSSDSGTWSLLLESNAACSGLCLVKHVDGVAQADPTQSNITEPVSFSTLQEIRRWRFLEPVYQHWYVTGESEIGYIGETTLWDMCYISVDSSECPNSQ